MTSSFSLYAPRDSGYHRLHPLTKLAISGAILIGGLGLGGTWPAFAVFVLIVVPLALWSRALRSLLRAIWPIALPFAISLFLIRGFIWPGGTPILTLGPVSLKAEGIEFALAAVGRIVAMVSAFLLLSLTTPPDALMLALTERGFPPMIAYIVLTTIQIVPRFQARAATILDAQRSRGLETEGSLPRRLRALLPLVVPLILSSIVDIEERAIALEARAFSRVGVKTSLLTLNDTSIQRVARWLILAVPLILIALRFALEIAA